MSITDAREYPNGAEVHSDLCIVGSGPAGIAIATSLSNSKLQITLLESGGYEYDAKVQRLASGKSLGLEYPDLSVARLRYLGGTSNHWEGNVRPLDGIDFEARDWIPDSGWPFGPDTLKAHYEKARRFLGLPDEAFDARAHSVVVSDTAWHFKGEVESRVFHTVGPRHVRLGKHYRKALQDQHNLNAILHANVTRIAADKQARTVTHLDVKTLTGKKLKIKARSYVIACGGIDNARLLLASNDIMPSGLGNGRDLVGRYFMEHLTNPNFGDLYPQHAGQRLDFYEGFARDWGLSWGILGLSASAQRRHRTPNVRFQFSRVTNKFNQHAKLQGFQSARELGKTLSARKWPRELGWHLANVIADIDEVAGSAYYGVVHGSSAPLVSVELVFIGEQIPNRDSRVVLGTERDALGMPYPMLDWRVSELDSQGTLRALHALATEMGRSELGRIALRFNGFATQPPKPHFHHMGTTRMSRSEHTGVVDSNCRVHGLANLFVAGSSVFPTGGNVNPTLTILALAYRLSEHLERVV